MPPIYIRTTPFNPSRSSTTHLVGFFMQTKLYTAQSILSHSTPAVRLLRRDTRRTKGSVESNSVLPNSTLLSRIDESAHDDPRGRSSFCRFKIRILKSCPSPVGDRYICSSTHLCVYPVNFYQVVIRILPLRNLKRRGGQHTEIIIQPLTLSYERSVTERSHRSNTGGL